MSEPIPSEYRGWWRITETSQWVDDGLDILGPALLSLTGHGDRLRMHCLLAYVNCKPTTTGVSFTWPWSPRWRICAFALAAASTTRTTKISNG